MNKQVAEAIEQSDIVLVGIGREFTEKIPEESKVECLAPYEESRFYANLPSDDAVIQAYNALRRQIGKKPYFVVTLNTDDLIYRSEFEAEQIVAPCGSMSKLQCKEHIIEAAPIREQMLRAWEDAHSVELEEEDISSDEANRRSEQINKKDKNMETDVSTAEALLSKYAVCPTCGAPLAFHTIANPDYLESGYLPQWEHYKKWLTATLNKKLCILELGVDFTFPQVIRFPFEKTAFYNKKATFVRVNSRFPQLEAELAAEGRAISVAESPVEMLLK
ncbi:MAG: hypothetical protein PUA72_05470 [Lachnospiraceae bacterium]|nr:hypothetical protein [Lachnospiraceae bacterium]